MSSEHIGAKLREIANGVDRAIGMPLPVAVEYSFDNIPEDLRTRCSWMPFRFAANRAWTPGDPHAWSKLPVNPRTGVAGSITNPDSWGSFEEVLGYYATHALDENPRTVAHGIGFVVSEPFVVCDLDHHVTGGRIDNRALAIVRWLETYCELSVSGTGLHVILRAPLYSARCRYPDGLEVYCRDRYMTVTGVVLRGCTAVACRLTELRSLCAQMLPAQVPAIRGKGVQNCFYNHTGAGLCSETGAPGAADIVQDVGPRLPVSERAVLR